MNLQEMMNTGQFSIEGIIEQIQDPQTKMIAQLWARQQQQSAAEPARPAVVYPAPDKMRTDIQDLIQMNRDLIRESRLLQDKLNQAGQLNNRLAAALGACTCWGEEVTCPHCQGEGRPGKREIDLQAFSHYVEPVIDVLTRPALGTVQN